MDIKVPYSAIKKFLKTEIQPAELASKVSLCGPTFDRVHKIPGDVIYEIEAITNRVDTASAFGVAREANAILNQFNIPSDLIQDPYQIEPDLYQDLPQTIKISVKDKDLFPRFCAISLKDVKIKSSDKATIKLLDSAGERAINNAVDITNELTLLYGFPSHIFDLDKIKNHSITLRQSKKGELITLLDGSRNLLKGGDLVIENDGKLIDLCGIMGGSLAEVDDKTKNILLIVPLYQPKKIRQTSLYLQKRTLAAQIYEKSPDIQLCLPILSLAVDMFSLRCGAFPSSMVFDYHPEALPDKFVDLDLVWLSNFIGVEISRESVMGILSDLGFSGKWVSYHKLRCKVPSWRYWDINIHEDLAEEVARVYGYFKLPAIIPSINLPAQKPNKLLSAEIKAKKLLANIGFHEILNNSLISKELIERTGLKIDDHIQLKNALSSDYEYLRTSLLPSLILNLKNNLNQENTDIDLFELSNIYLKTNSSLPNEISTISFITTRDIRHAKGVIETLAKHLNLPELTYTPGKSDEVISSNQTANIVINHEVVGKVGTLDPRLVQEFELEKPPSLLEIDFVKLTSMIRPGYTYSPASPYPSVVEDVTIDSAKTISEILTIIKRSDPAITKVLYQNSFKGRHTFRINFTSYKGNLDEKTVSKIKEKIILKIKS